MSDYTNKDEKMECLNCEWTGMRSEMPDEDICPECECDGYIQAVYDDDDDE